MYATVQKDEGQGHFAQPKKLKEWAGWRPSTEDEQIEFEKKVTGTNGAENQDSLAVIPKHIEETAKSISHTTKSTRQKEVKKNSGRCYTTRESERRDDEDQFDGKFSGCEQEGPGSSMLASQFDTWQENTKNNTLDRAVRQRQLHRR